jgi:hypothetical protein
MFVMSKNQLLVGLLAFVLPASAFAQTSSAGDGDGKRECAAQHEQAQVLRNGGRLIESVAAMRSCSQQSCPAAVREDCVQWFEEVKRSIPSVVVTARSGELDQVDVRVSIDGKLALSHLDGQPLELNPGAHKFRFECPGFEPVERQVLLSPGEKLRPISVSFAEPQESEAGSAGLEPAPVTRAVLRPSPKARSSVPPLAYVAAATALAGAAGFAAFGLWGLDRRSELESSCRPACEASQVRSVRTKFLLADISLGVSLAATVTAGVLYFSKPSSSAPPTERSAQTKSAAGVARRWSASIEADPAGAAMTLKGDF